jgi:hypothetical protein
MTKTAEERAYQVWTLLRIKRTTLKKLKVLAARSDKTMDEIVNLLVDYRNKP